MIKELILLNGDIFLILFRQFESSVQICTELHDVASKAKIDYMMTYSYMTL